MLPFTQDINKSHFFLTLNTNKVMESQVMRNVYSDALNGWVEFYFGGMKDLLSIDKNSVRWNIIEDKLSKVFDIHANTRNRNNIPDWRDIFSVKVESAIEEGKKLKGRRLHIHVHLTVIHSVALILNHDGVKDSAMEFLDISALGPYYGLHNIYLNIQSSGDVDHNRTRYLNKDKRYPKPIIL